MLKINKILEIYLSLMKVWSVVTKYLALELFDLLS